MLKTRSDMEQRLFAENGVRYSDHNVSESSIKIGFLEFLEQAEKKHSCETVGSNNSNHINHTILYLSSSSIFKGKT